MVCLTLLGKMEKLLNTKESEKKTVNNAIGIIAKNVIASLNDEAAVEEADLEEADLEEADVEETAVEETAVEETAVEETAVEETAVEETAVEETAVEETDVEETAVEDTVVESKNKEVSSKNIQNDIDNAITDILTYYETLQTGGPLYKTVFYFKVPTLVES